MTKSKCAIDKQTGQEIKLSEAIPGRRYICPVCGKNIYRPVEFEHCNDNEDQLIFRNWLPTSQQRLLLAVGHEVHEKLPLVYQFLRIYREDIFQQVQRLSIQMPSNNAF